MSSFPPSLEKVIEAFSRFPGIGKKTAQRLGFHVLKSDKENAIELANALVEVKENIHFCEICHHIAEVSPCPICTDERRDKSIICVVETPEDIFLFEKTGFRGIYHVLGGVISPLDGIGPDDLNIEDLLNRLTNVNEVIVATNANIEGDATALYLARLLSPMNIKVSRLARGLPVGGHLEYVDDATLLRSIDERVEIQ
ncbi:MAG: recombination protein RecR [Candidatus Marinimicrobia bacterium]|nr:recombination protein RecR [Candidatus Neomarinimicrobiota bacterium]MBL7023625.1 recombination protein RecR [Candidatus Neomarinimicrobiota bacterium]MBL7109812.1 recombination protein RecR [Candidatus Neomarinimicrobiota bacterium]